MDMSFGLCGLLYCVLLGLLTYINSNVFIVFEQKLW